MTILIFGDSITYGACDNEGGWVKRLRKFLDDKNLSDESDFSVYNLGINGDNTEALLKRFEQEIRIRFDSKEKTIFIFAIGINDSQFIPTKNSFRVPLENFKNNILFLISRVKQFSGKIIFVGLTPIKELKTTPIPWDTDKFYKNEYIQKYDEIIKKVCEENDLLFIEVFDQLKGNENLSEDGLHPNSEGHRKIFEIVKDFFIINKIIVN